jgi:D-alanyl-D-alanine carboxypeptidase
MAFDIKPNTELSSNLDLFSAWVESQMAYKGLPGMSVGLVYDQELIWTKGFGYADVEKKIAATPETIYRIASITKLFTSTAILQLRDAGKLQLDDPVSKHLPWFSIKKKEDDASVIRIRHLLTHTSGLPRESAFPYWSTAEFPTYEEMEKALPGQQAVFPAERRWKYSNLALAVAGEIVAAVSGVSYEEYVEENILKPLGMTSTHVRTIDAGHPQLAVGYSRRLPDTSRSISPFEDCKGISPAANIATNVQDLAKFAMLQFRDGPAGRQQILKGDTLREMHTVHWLDEDWQMGWGWGFNVIRAKGKTYIGHGGSLMGYRTQLLLLPEEKVGIIIMTNADDGDPGRYSEKAVDWVFPSIVKAAKSDLPQKEVPETWHRYTGKYRSIWGDTQVMVYKGELVAIDPSAADPSEDIVKLEPVGEHTFRIQMKSGYGGVGELAVFELDENDKVKRLRTGENYSEPIEKW